MQNVVFSALDHLIWRAFVLNVLTWAARYNTWLLIELMPRGVVFSFFPFLSFPFLSFPFLSFPFLSFLFLSFPFLSFSCLALAYFSFLVFSCPTCSCAMLVQALTKVLYDMMHQLAYTTPAQMPQMPYSDIGLAKTDMHMLRNLSMSVIRKCLTTQPERLAFGAQALPLCTHWLVTLASSGMKSYTEGQDVMAGHKGLSHLALSYSDVVGKRFYTVDSIHAAIRDNTMCCKAAKQSALEAVTIVVGLEPLTMSRLTCSGLRIHADQQ